MPTSIDWAEILQNSINSIPNWTIIYSIRNTWLWNRYSPFFAQYFLERYYFLDWPFPDLPEEDLTEFADFFYKITNYPMRFSIYRMYKLMIAISIYRIKMVISSDLPNHFMMNTTLLMSIPNFEEILVHFSEKLGLEITPDIIAQILFPLFKTIFS